jgi:hypothetical protein
MSLRDIEGIDLFTPIKTNRISEKMMERRYSKGQYSSSVLSEAKNIQANSSYINLEYQN